MAVAAIRFSVRDGEVVFVTGATGYLGEAFVPLLRLA